MKLESYARWNRGEHHKPLRSAKELAIMLDLTMPQLRGHLAKIGAPKPELFHRKSGAWYKPDEFIAWFRREMAR